MAATKEEIRGWLKRGIKDDYSHVIVVCDTYDYEDFPVFVAKSENVLEIKEKNEKASMQKIMEIYNLSMDVEAQLNEKRAFNI